MNIYHVLIDQDGYGLNAVVSAESELDVERILDLSDLKKIEYIRLIGLACFTVENEFVWAEELL